MNDDIQSLWIWRGLVLSVLFCIFCEMKKQTQLMIGRK